MWFVSNLNINAENLSCIVSRIRYARAISSLRTQAKSCVRKLILVHIARVSFGLIFQKYIYLLIKSYIFHFNTFQVNLTSDWALNQPWVLEFNIIGEWGLESYGVQNVVSTYGITKTGFQLLFYFFFDFQDNLWLHPLKGLPQ